MKNRGWVWTGIFSLASLPLLGFWLYGLTDLDEGFYAAVIGEMNRRAEWITPFYNGHPWFEKPILLYWVTKPSLAIFGGEFGLRLPAILATLALYGVAAWFASRRLFFRTGQWSVLVLGTCLLTVAIGRMILTDALLTLCLSGALLCFFESLVGDRRFRLLSAFFLGLSVLAKGPVGCVIFALVLAITYWREPQLRAAFRGWWTLGTAIFAATVATWYVPAYLVDGRLFVDEFLIKQNLQRFTGGDVAHTLHGPASWFFFIPILIAGLLPWTFWLWPAVRDAVRLREDPASPARRFLLTWAAVVFVFFSASGAKLPHYILPAIPPLAILVADIFARRERSGTAQLVPWAAAFAAAGMCLFVNTGMIAWDRGVFKGMAPQSDARRLALEARSLLEQNPTTGVAIYKMGRQNKDMGTGHLKVQETALPSLLFYLDRDAIETDDFAAIAHAGRPMYILTRVGRIGSADMGLTSERLQIVDQNDYFMLYLLSPFKQPVRMH